MVADHCGRPLHLRRPGASRRNCRHDRAIGCASERKVQLCIKSWTSRIRRRVTDSTIGATLGRAAGGRERALKLSGVAGRGKRDGWRASWKSRASPRECRASQYSTIWILASKRTSCACCSDPNGAGKTTLICMITGQFKPVAGSIHFAGRDITGWAPRRHLPGWNQPQVPSAQHVRDVVGIRQHYGLAAGSAAGVCHAVSAAERRGA